MEMPYLRNSIIKTQKFENAIFLTGELQRCKPLYYCRLGGILHTAGTVSDVEYLNDRNNHEPI